MLELIATLAILGTVALIAIPAYRAVISNTRTSVAQNVAQSVGREILALAIADGTGPRTGPLGTENGAYVATLAQETPTATLAQSTSFQTNGKVTVTASGTTACLTLPSGSSGDFTVTEGACQ